ncbi:fumarylacetoacetate hydrolase family protein [Paeniglutamicibacter psychrophenolicus]|uniref:2-keto-4-pentenoate hydratase/2-oxohepta-3-ene-1,7-dioic acid hydratase in catechol pathway n=1 Tax=Paeniglutamicibacter psychrophenolicus TaxID=257454 RepID=A0ABS4W9E5_9MICC|nr:fumarylacetoacetate hydrolase family protein [Paeniglutamicibacter psychrophenolicus]MBP2372827.1 2-keto-4-pentenoate hydratase/2-oxohepta-3-ene-1,7-dioic acid hydratase in catechol pathway [Paeniglutamicibacter psychrophenolicus]
MKFVTFNHRGTEHAGVLNEEGTGVIPVPGSQDLLSLIDNWTEAASQLATVTGPAINLADVELLAPIPVPRRNIFCVGRNYVEHAKEFANSGYDATASATAQPEYPVVFTKAPSTVIGTGADIDPHTGVTSELDYEAELGVIIGIGGRGISRADALDHVWGYTIINDVTARDLQKDHKQWFLGKSLDTHAPMGPWAVTRDEIGDGPLDLHCSVNGETRQKATTADLIFDIPTIIETISAGITLQPGDIIATGTPVGVGIGFTPPRFLGTGDVVEISITGLGTLSNRIGEGR